MVSARVVLRQGAALATEIYALHLEAPLMVREPDRAEVLSTSLRFASTACDAVYIALALASDLSVLTAERTTTPRGRNT